MHQTLHHLVTHIRHNNHTHYSSIFIVELYTTYHTQISCINYHTIEYITTKGVTNMLIKINKKPIHVVEEEDEKEFSWVYMTVSSIGYLMILSIMDYSCYLFIGKHIFPFISWLTKLLLLIL
jgi:hypothetical protein